MIFKSMDAPVVDYQEVESEKDSQSNPRCSLDFQMQIESQTGVTVLNAAQLRLQSFQGHESISQLFELQLELRANGYNDSNEYQLQTPPNIPNYLFDGTNSDGLASYANETIETLDFDQVLGANATIMLGTPETANDVNQQAYPASRPVVYFNGIVTNFALAQRGVYHATVKPALYKLTLQNHYRIFDDATILDVVIDVLSQNNIAFNRSDLEKQPCPIVKGLANYRKQDWLQAGESDFDFITRLLNKVNLFYYFTHEQNKHEMVITDQPYYAAIYQREINEQGYNKETDSLKSLYLSYSKQTSLDRDDYIEDFKFQQNLTTNGLTTVLAQKEAVWESQNTAQTTPVFLNNEHTQQKLNIEHIHTVQYGATKNEVNKITDTAINQLHAAQFDFSGSSSCAELKAGHKFKVSETWQDSSKNSANINRFTSSLPICPSLDNQEFAVTSVQYNADANGHYSNQFKAVSASGIPTPFNPNSGQQGNILARVTDKSSASAQSVANSQEVLVQDHKGSSAKQLEKSVFTYDSKSFEYQDNDQYSCRGVYVRFIDRPDSEAPVWVKLAEHMQTIPEVGVYVVVSRSADSNEIPEIQQILQAKGNKVIMPDGYTCNTNVGNSYSTNYGNSTSIGFGADVNTALSKAKNIVNNQRQTNHYNDVRFSQSSAYSYSVTARSHNISVLGAENFPDYSPSTMMEYVSYNHSETTGDTYNESTHIGVANNISVQVGATNNVSTQTGAATSVTNMNGATTNTYVGIGVETSASTKTGIQLSASNINGLQFSTSLVKGNASNSNTVVGNSTNTSTTTGNNVSTNTMIGNTTNTQTTTGNATHTSTMIGNTTSTNTVTGNSTNTSVTTGNTTNTQTTTGNATNVTTMTGNTTNTNTITGNSTSINTTTGNATNTQTITGNTTNTTTITGNAVNTNTTTGNTTNTTTITGNATNTSTTTGNTTDTRTYSGTHTVNENITNQTMITNTTSGTELRTDLRSLTRNYSTITDLVTGTVTIL